MYNDGSSAPTAKTARPRRTHCEDRPLPSFEDRPRDPFMLHWDRVVVQPPGHLRVVPTDEKALTAFTKQYGLCTVYLNDMLAGGRKEHKGWQRLDCVRWLKHEVTGELVVVVGGPSIFLHKVASQRSDMPFSKTNFTKLLAGDYCNGDGFHLDVYKQWRLMRRTFQPPEVAALSDGASLAGFFAARPPTAVEV